VTNRPVNYSDPTGHMQASDAYEDSDGKCKSADKGCNEIVARIEKKKHDKPGDASNATIRIGFGNFVNGKPVGYGGLGTVVYNSNGTSYIVTAWHVYSAGDYFFYRTGEDAQWNYLSIHDVNLYHQYGKDILFIQLPMELPKEFVPTEIGHVTFTGGEQVTVAYQDERGLHVLETEVRTNNTNVQGMYQGHSSVTVTNPMNNPDSVLPILNRGDSGGGVFYNGQLVGVSSGIGTDFWGPYMRFEQP
jgi:hypothetical protein